MCVAWHTCLKHTRRHAHTHAQHHVQHKADVHIDTASNAAHIHHRHTGTYLQSISLPSFKCKSDQILSIFPISHIHNASTTQCLYSSNRTKRGEVWNVHVKVGCCSALFLPQTDARVCSWGEVLQYVSSAVTEKLCSESELYRQGRSHTLDMSVKERKTWLSDFKSIFLFRFCFPNVTAVIDI